MIYLKSGAYVINVYEYKPAWTHWIALYVNSDNMTYFDSLGDEHVPKSKEMKTLPQIFSEYKHIIH